MSFNVAVFMYIFQDTFNTIFSIYCDQGNRNGADKLLDYIKMSGMPLTDAIHASMVTGYSRAGELEQAKNLIESLRVKGQVPPARVYSSLLCAYAERGLLDEIKEVIIN